ncbi:ATP-binding protein, partial [Streptomyces anulatus]
MRAWGEPAERIETAALIVTELVTNAVQHTTTRKIRCRLLRSADGVRICVWNRGRARIPSPASPGDSAGLPVAGVPATD